MKIFPALIGLLFLGLLWQAPSGASATLGDLEACGLPINRLPPLFVPDKYQLTLAPNLTSLDFSGSVDILTSFTGDLGDQKLSLASVIKQVCLDTIGCGLNRCGLKLKRRILLNVGKTIDIDDLQVFKLDKDGQPSVSLEVENICIDRASQVMEVVLARKLRRGDKISIQIAYRGKIAKESRGLYESLNRVAGTDGHSSEAQVLNANTHFFPADARSTFPSFDQPDMKANFNLKLVHDKELSAISNAKKLEERVDSLTGLKHVQFAETPKMSTYVFAFAVGHYESISCQVESGMTRPVVTAYAPAGRSHEAQFTLDTVCKSIPLIEQYFLKEFPLSKLDLVVTRQMRDPARENWGLLAFTEDFLLTDERDTTNVLRVEIAKLAVHNVLHHWFGDLVTAKWWDDQWIFDGFTIWRSHLVAGQIYPHFDYNFNYLLRLQSPTLDAHSVTSSKACHAIKTFQDLKADDELALFDAPTYNKAAALYQMIHAHLGEFLFRDSLSTFVTRHAYGVANSKNFTDAIEQASGVNLEKLIASWTDQAGVPLVTVERVSQIELELKQERLAEARLTGEERAQRWTIPIEILFADQKGNQATVRVTLEETSAKVRVPVWFDNFNLSHWFKVNPNFSGLYRVNYAQNMLKRLQAPIEQKQLSPQDRYNVIDDMRALANLGKVTSKELEDVLKWYEDETSGGVLSGLAQVVQTLAKRESGGRVAEIVHRLFDQVYEQSRFKVYDEQSHAEMNGRQDALLELIRYDYKEAVEEALQVFEATDVHLTPFLRKPVYLSVLKRGSDIQVDDLFERLHQTKSDYERQILVMGLLPYLDADDEQVKERLLAAVKSS